MQPTTSELPISRSESPITNYKVSAELKPHEISYEDLKLDKLIGQSNSATIRHGSLKKKEIAAKIFELESNSMFTPEQLIEMAETEAKIMLELNSKYTVNLRHVCIHDYEELQSYFLIMDYYKQSLFDRLYDTSKPVTVQQMFNWSIQIGEGIEFMHKKGYLHRDLKIKNILLDAKEYSVLADFGISHKIGTFAQPEIGTRGYQAPETYESHYAATPSDIYSFGVVLSLIVRQKHSTSATDMCHQIKQTNFYRVDTLECFKNIISLCVQQDPKERPSIEKVITLLKEERQQYTSKHQTIAKSISESAASPIIEEKVVSQASFTSSELQSEKVDLTALKKLSLVAAPQPKPARGVTLSTQKNFLASLCKCQIL